MPLLAVAEVAVEVTSDDEIMTAVLVVLGVRGGDISCVMGRDVGLALAE